jgi:ankyrin repeat protein
MSVVMALFLSVPTSKAHEEVDDDITSEHEGLREAAKYAISKGDKALFDTLLKAGLQINKPLDTESKELALHEAVMRKNPDMIRYLMQQGASPLLRDRWGQRPIDHLEYRREIDIAPILAALIREPTAYDKKLLMGIPVPVWREILGAPECPEDPLSPPVGDTEVAHLIPFISINEEDPSPEMTPVLNAHFPGWRPGSRVEEAKEKDEVAGYRDKQSHEAGLLVQIALVSTTSKDIAVNDSGKLTSYVRSKDLPAYQFKVRRATGPILAGGGWGGHVVLLAGYWVKAGTAGWDE